MARLAEHQRPAVRFWEWRRVAYNLALMPATALGYIPRSGVYFEVGDVPAVSNDFVLRVFAGCAIGANVCYSFAYALEFFLGSADPAAGWNVWGRRITFFVGTGVSMCIAFWAAFNLAATQVPD